MTTTGIAALAVLLTGACLQGLTGFGYSMFSLPLLALFMPVQEAVPILSMTSIVLNLMVFLHARGSTSVKRVLPLLLAGAAGLPIGVYVLGRLDENFLKGAVGVLVIISSVLYLSGFRVRVHREKSSMIPVGLVSGVLNGSTTFSGPPVILFLSNQKVPRDAFRGSLAVYFLMLNVLAAPAFLAGGFLTQETALGAARGLPAVLAGGLLGNRLASRLGEGVFRQWALAALLLLGVFSLLSAVFGGS